MGFDYDIPYNFTFKTLDFLHEGKQVKLRNPKVTLYLRKANIKYEYKVQGEEENRENDGFFFGNIDFNRQTIEFRKIKIPDIYFEVLKKEYEEITEINRKILVDQDFKYTLHDTTSYGIYNGISDFDLEEIISDIKKELHCKPFIFASDVYKILTADPEIEQIALNTYVPYPVKDGWSEEYKRIHAKMVENKTAVGYGTIPNAVIRRKLKELILEKHNKELEQQDKIKSIFEKAKSTGIKQLLRTWSREVDEEENSIVFYYEYAMPDGRTETIENRAY
jgi:hypothetical protein